MTAAADVSVDRPVRRGGVIVAGLAISQTVGYGALYYAFPVLLVPIATDLQASTTAVTGAFTAATLAGAATAVPVGRWLDRHGGRGLMTTGSIAGTLLLILAAQVTTLTALYAVWIGIGLVSAAVLYEAAFAVIVTWYPSRQQRNSALLTVTIVAGFAGSIFLPLTGALVATHGWRTALILLAALHGLLTIPAHLLLRRPPGAPTGFTHTGLTPAAARSGPGGTTTDALRDSAFRLLVAAFVAHAAAVAIIGVHLVAYLIELGHPPAFAATIAGGLGVLSVTGRVVTTGAQRRWTTTTVVATMFLVQAAAALALPIVGTTSAGAMLAVLGFGLGFGVATLARPALLADRYGPAKFATISGVLTIPMAITKALAPLAAAALHQLAGSYTTTAITVALCCTTASGGLVLAARRGPGGNARRAAAVRDG